MLGMRIQQFYTITVTALEDYIISIIIRQLNLVNLLYTCLLLKLTSSALASQLSLPSLPVTPTILDY